MKLDHYDMLYAFERRDVAAMIRIAAQHYSLELTELEIVAVYQHEVMNRDGYEMRIDLDGSSYVWHGKLKFYYPFPAEITYRNCCHVWW